MCVASMFAVAEKTSKRNVFKRTNVGLFLYLCSKLHCPLVENQKAPWSIEFYTQLIWPCLVLNEEAVSSFH